MADIVQQRSRGDRPRAVEWDDRVAIARAQVAERLASQEEHAERMLEAGVPRAGPDARGEAQLLDSLQPLEWTAY